ncbi:40S ribosomal protein S18, putative [Leishmania tarentolae]|uniref:40S ribosomal protein S18, putative n=1 Tax=Leishmania tarentolae TaxID=5689 RepID=A0A640KV76_LEITA|nr:40S ribosomal protein S18, putative [Leishmania tarentolae]
MAASVTPSLLSARHTDRLAVAAARACVLAAHAEAVGVAHTTVRAHLLQALKVIAQAGVHHRAGQVLRLAGLGVALTVQEPVRDLELRGVGDDLGDLLQFLRGQSAGAALHVDPGLLAHQVRKADTNTLHHAQRKRHLALALHIRVEQTHDVLEMVRDKRERHFWILSPLFPAFLLFFVCGGDGWKEKKQRRASDAVVRRPEYR